MTDHLLGLLRNPDVPNWVVRSFLIDEEVDVANVYTVYGESGSYSDYQSWQVAAFLDRSQADRFAARCNEYAKDHANHQDSRYEETERLAEAAGLEVWEYRQRWNTKPDAPDRSDDARSGYGGVKYGVTEILLRLEE